LSSEGVKPIEIYKRMMTQFGDACLSLQQMYEWDRKLNNVVSSVADAEHTGCPYTACTPETVEHVERVIQGNHLVATVEVALQLGINHGSAHHIMHDCTSIPPSVCKMSSKSTHIRTEGIAYRCLQRTFWSLSN
jgi:hypothetical protein